MFMNSTLTLQHLSLFGGMTNAISTEIGGDQRSIFVQPITAAGGTEASDATDYTTTTRGKSLPAEYGDWLKTTIGYSEAASKSQVSASMSGSAGLGASSSTLIDLGSIGRSEEATDSGTDPVTETVEAVVDEVVEQASENTAQSNRTRNRGSGGLLGGLLGGLFGR